MTQRTYWTWSHPLWKIPLSAHWIPDSLQLISKLSKACGTKLCYKILTTNVATHMTRCLKCQKIRELMQTGERIDRFEINETVTSK